MAKIKVMPSPAKEVVPMPDGRGAAGQAVRTDSAAPPRRPAPSLRPAAAVPDRRAVIAETSGSLAGIYEPGGLERLRGEWR